MYLLAYGNGMRRLLLCALFLGPLLAAVVAGIVGIEVSSRDDANYLAALDDRDFFVITPDAISWLLLLAITSVTGHSAQGLRWVGLILGALTIITISRRRDGAILATLFVVSVLPLYLNIYFNQLRLAVAVFIFSVVVTGDRFRGMAVPAAALAHASFLLIAFPPLAVLIPLGLQVASHLDPDSFAAIKSLAYLQGDSADMPWYFGWELLGIGGVLAVRRRWRWGCELLVVIWAVREVGADLSLDIGRRVLELAMLAYSPFFLRVQRGFGSSSLLNSTFIALAIMQTVVSFQSQVVQI